MGRSGIIRGIKKDGMYNIIPIPYTEEIHETDDSIILNSNLILKRQRLDDGILTTPYDYIMADAIVLYSDTSDIYIKSEYNNYFIKKPFDAVEKSRIDIHKSLGMNVYSCFIPLTPFDAEGETKVDEVILRNTIDNPRYSMITLPLRYKDYNVVFFEDDYYEF